MSFVKDDLDFSFFFLLWKQKLFVQRHFILPIYLFTFKLV
jgi:hypothetical protein